MAFREIDQTSRLWRTAVWTLRITVALECLGTWGWLTQYVETPLLGWLLDPTDVGGLAWNESTALAVQQAIGWLTLVAGVCVLVRPCAPVLGPLTLLQLLVAVATWRVDAGFPLESPWLSPQVAALFPFATQMARIAAPLGLLLVDPWKVPRPLAARRVRLAIGLLRWALAITFAAHGIEAWQHHPEFIDYWITTTQRLLGTPMSQPAAERLLSLFGAVDLLAALALVTTRWRAVGWWMAMWGAVTALSRITTYGFHVGWHAALIRAPHCGLALAVVLVWHLVRCQGPAASREPASDPD